MSKKKLEVIELNKKEEKIVLEEEQSQAIVFWKKYRKLIFGILLVLSLTILIIGGYLFFINLNASEKLIIKQVSVDTTLTEDMENIFLDGTPITSETAKNSFLNDGTFKRNGEVLVVKTVEADSYLIKFFSDGTALKILKATNLITRINPLENGGYGIDSTGVINTKAQVKDVTIKNIKTFDWGTVTYYSDGSALITDSNFDIFVRNSNDIQEKYISNNKVTYLKETKKVGTITLNYYHDGTIEVIKNNKSYLVRNESDLKITKDDVIFKNNNQKAILTTKKLDDGNIIDYYKDGGAIIRNGTKTLSVRKSNSIIIKDNKIYEIVDNIYVTVSDKSADGNAIYYTNGGAVVNFNGKKYYLDENSNITYKDGKIQNIGSDKEELTNSSNVSGTKIQTFEKTAVVETDEYIAIVPKDNILYDKDGGFKGILTNEIENEDNTFTITNNTNEELKYRVVIKKSDKTDLDIEYIRYQLKANDIYIEESRLDKNIWKNDVLADGLKIEGINYILIDGSLYPQETANISFMLWTDYDTIPNTMQNKYFYGTLKIYAWIEETSE